MNNTFSLRCLHVSDKEYTSAGFKNIAICPSTSLLRANNSDLAFPLTLESTRSSNDSMSSIMTRTSVSLTTDNHSNENINLPCDLISCDLNKIITKIILLFFILIILYKNEE